MSQPANPLSRITTGVAVSSTSLQVTDPNMTFETFENAIRGVAVIGDSARWWLGDLLLFGESRYGEEYAQALHAARLSERQLNRYRYVCQQIARSRRRENLPFSYHEEVSGLEPADQDALLRRAESEGWSREELREARRNVVRRVPPAAGRSAVVLEPPAATVDAARGLSDARKALETVAGAIDSEEGREAVGIPSGLRGLEEASRAVRQLGRVLPLREAARRVRESAVRQSGLPDPAYIVPAGPFEAFLAALEEAE